jgi:hypothetical protein
MSRYSEYATMREEWPETKEEAYRFLGYAALHIRTASHLLAIKEWSARVDAGNLISDIRSDFFSKATV